MRGIASGVCNNRERENAVTKAVMCVRSKEGLALIIAHYNY